MPDSIVSQFQREFNQPIETFRKVDTIAQRNAISTQRRWEGMLVYVVEDQTTYELKGGVDNTDWTTLGGLGDAPQDGTLYGRQNGNWVPVNGNLNKLVYINGFATIKGENNVSLDHQVGDTIIYRNPTTKVRAEYYVAQVPLTLPADFSNRAKLEMYNPSKPSL